MIEDRIKVLSVGLSDKPKPTKLNLARKILSAVRNFFKVKFLKIQDVGNLTYIMKKIWLF